MKETAPRLQRSNVEKLRNFSDPRGSLASIATARIVAVFLILLITFPIDTADSAGVPDIAQSSTLKVWPAGTRLLIPNRVMEYYQKEADSWSRPSVYLFANYFLTAPSFWDKGKETVYLPLVKELAGKTEQREIWVNIMNIRRVRNNESVFVTIGEIHVVDISTNGKDLYVSVKADN